MKQVEFFWVEGCHPHPCCIFGSGAVEWLLVRRSDVIPYRVVAHTLEQMEGEAAVYPLFWDRLDHIVSIGEIGIKGMKRRRKKKKSL